MTNPVYRVEWYPPKDIDAYMSDNDCGPDDRIDAALQCCATKAFSTIDAARSWAKAILRGAVGGDEFGSVGIEKLERVVTDCHDGGPPLIDWTPVDETEYVSDEEVSHAE